MRVLVDTSVWSQALRRKQPGEEVAKLTKLILQSMVVMIGSVRQEVLSGISDKMMFEDLKDKLSSFPDIPINTKDYETAAEFFNVCRKNGIQGSHIDFLICAIAHNNDLLIYTTDQDFNHFAKHLPINLL